MTTPNTQITDTDRLEAMFRHGWRVHKHKGKARISGINEAFASPREALDHAIKLFQDGRRTKYRERLLLTSPIPSDFIWNRWEQHVFPAETPRFALIESARMQGWKLSIVANKKSKKLFVMAMDPIMRSSCVTTSSCP